MNSLHRDLKKLVQQAEEMAQSHRFTLPYQLHFHLMPPTGWLNDPNGLCQANGLYHVFFQYSPFDAYGGLKFWGHYESPDFLHWRYTGTPLLPDQPFDCHGVYSGSAYTEDGEMHLFYTGNVKLQGDYNYITDGRGSATVRARYDFETGEATGKHCVLKNEDYPVDLTCHVRDPKVWREADAYHMILGARSKSDTGMVLLLRSDDLEHWTLMHRITARSELGYMWECPDLFSLGDERILSVSPQGMQPEGFRFQNVYQSGWFSLKEEDAENSACRTTGSATGTEISGCFHEWDYGFDFYAPQTFLDNTGRRILIGWMGIPDSDAFYQNPTAKDGWQHALTIPRVLEWKHKTICQKPIEELAQLRKETHILTTPTEIAPCFELMVENPAGTSFHITVGGMLFRFDKNSGTAVLTFTDNSGAGRTERKASLLRCHKLHAFIDSSSAEFFLNDGEVVFTSRFYPSGQTVLLVAAGDKLHSTFWPLGSFTHE